ncbi:MAG: RdgB/HAM1 family non-canonical purine NTP pyrophosphatase [Candidatus Micrarchaeota archaeon]
MPSSEILFLTSNAHKAAEARSILNKYGISIIDKSAKGIEIQSDSLADVARFCAQDAYKRFGRPLFVEDSGLFIDALHGFPGVYSSTAYAQIGCPGILRLLSGLQNRAAQFKCAVAFIDRHGARIFEAESEGSISNEEKGPSGFGYDPIFIPKGHEKTFAQDPALKARLSHRARALDALGRYILRLTTGADPESDPAHA